MPGIHLVRHCSSPEVIEALEGLACEVRDKPMVGLIYVAMFAYRRYAIGIKGMARTSATYARGTLLAVDDELRTIVNRRKT